MKATLTMLQQRPIDDLRRLLTRRARAVERAHFTGQGLQLKLERLHLLAQEGVLRLEPRQLEVEAPLVEVLELSLPALQLVQRGLSNKGIGVCMKWSVLSAW